MPASPQGTFASFVTRPIVRLLHDRGHDAGSFAARVGEARDELLRPDGRIDLDLMGRALDELAPLVDDPAVGLALARHADYATFGPLGAAFAAGGRLRDVFALCTRYSSIVTDALDVRFEEREDLSRLTLEVHEGMKVHPQALLLGLVLTRDFVRARVGRLDPTRVVVHGIDPAGRDAIAAYFGCPVEVGETFLIEFAEGLGGEVLAGSDPEIAAAIERTLDARVERGGVRIVDELRAFIEAELAAGQPSIEAAASKFRTTTRSLQRRLKDHHTTWQTVIDDTRKRLAGRFVSETPMSFTDIARRLGFADLSSFSRAFRKWYGTSAREFRSSSTRSRFGR